MARHGSRTDGWSKMDDHRWVDTWMGWNTCRWVGAVLSIDDYE